MSGGESEKRTSGALFAGGKGKRVVAGARLPAAVVRGYLHTSPEELRELWQQTVLGHLQAGALGYNGQLANGLTALFIACGQDVANVANAAVGITAFEVTRDGDLYAAVTLPSLTVATVGGGTGAGHGARVPRDARLRRRRRRRQAGRDRRRHGARRRAVDGRRDRHRRAGGGPRDLRSQPAGRPEAGAGSREAPLPGPPPRSRSPATTRW